MFISSVSYRESPILSISKQIVKYIEFLCMIRFVAIILQSRKVCRFQRKSNLRGKLCMSLRRYRSE